MLLSNIKKDINWEIVEQPVFYGQNPYTQSDAYKAILRQDENGSQHKPFTISKNSYNPPSIAEFKQYVNELQEITEFSFEGFQTYGNGVDVFGYLKNNGKLKKIVGHEMEEYMLVGVSFDGSKSFFVGSVNNLLRCKNQFGLISRTWKVKNTAGRHVRTEELFLSFESYIQEQKELHENFERFAQVKISPALIEKATRYLLEIKQEDKLTQLSSRKQNQYLALTSSLQRETKDLGMNLWGLFNGVTHYTTHKLEKKEAEKNVFGNVIGDIRTKLNKETYQNALSLTNIGKQEEIFVLS